MRDLQAKLQDELDKQVEIKKEIAKKEEEIEEIKEEERQELDTNKALEKVYDDIPETDKHGGEEEQNEMEEQLKKDLDDMEQGKEPLGPTEEEGN